MRQIDLNNGTTNPTGTVLIVDDNADDVKAACRAIGTLYPQLCTRAVYSGEELLCYLKGETGFSDRKNFPYPVLILLDLKMSGMDGFDVLLWLRNNPPHNFVPVVVLTGGDGKAQCASRAYALGARSFLTKPLQDLDIQNTVQTLQDWLQLVREEPENKQKNPPIPAL
jgi:CheY-like chemotaxis protein